MLGPTRDEALVALFECLPRGHRAGIRHAAYCARVVER
jgi:hypothetical protein